MVDTPSSETDLLLRRAAKGDVHAQSEILDRYRDRIKRMVAIRLDRRLAAGLDPSDVVQEAMKTAHQRMPEYFANPQLPFYPWLRRIAWNRLIDMYRTHVTAERRSVLKEQEYSPRLSDESVADLAHNLVISSAHPGRRAMLAEMEARMKAALLQLKPHDREVLVLRYLEQLEVAEIADVLGISQTAVTSRQLRALQRLRMVLGDESGGGF